MIIHHIYQGGNNLIYLCVSNRSLYQNSDVKCYKLPAGQVSKNLILENAKCINPRAVQSDFANVV